MGFPRGKRLLCFRLSRSLHGGLESPTYLCGLWGRVSSATGDLAAPTRVSPTSTTEQKHQKNNNQDRFHNVPLLSEPDRPVECQLTSDSTTWPERFDTFIPIQTTYCWR